MTSCFLPFAERSNRWQKLFAKFNRPTLVLVSSGQEAYRNRDVDYAFRAESAFQYLAGFDEPQAILALWQTDTEFFSAMFLRPKDTQQEIWQGYRLGVEAAPEALQLNFAHNIADFSGQLVEILNQVCQVAFPFEDESLRQAVFAAIAQQKNKQRQGLPVVSRLMDLSAPLDELRLIKSPWEIAQMRQAAQISVAGHLKAMEVAQDAQYEYQVQAALEAEFRHLGSPRVAFNSIVASGSHACVLHYTSNQGKIDPNALILVDAGAEFCGYAGDITHTFPARGKFTPAQAQIYTLVLHAQQAALAEIKVGNPMRQAHIAAQKCLAQGLIDLGFLFGTPDSVIEDKSLMRYFMHGTGHWLGLDVHDVGEYKIANQWRPFAVGMVITLEPGLYLPLDDLNLPEEYRGIGVRIEDDVWLSEEGAVVLTQGLPRSVAEIEQWIAQRIKESV